MTKGSRNNLFDSEEKKTQQEKSTQKKHALNHTKMPQESEKGTSKHRDNEVSFSLFVEDWDYRTSQSNFLARRRAYEASAKESTQASSDEAKPEPPQNALKTVPSRTQVIELSDPVPLERLVKVQKKGAVLYRSSTEASRSDKDCTKDIPKGTQLIELGDPIRLTSLIERDSHRFWRRKKRKDV